MPTYPPFEVKIDNREVRQALERLLNRVEDMTPVMEDIARSLGNLAEDAIQAETDPWGDRWPDLSDAYVERPREDGGRGGDAHPILQRDGLLAASLAHQGDAHSAAVSIGRVYGAAVTLGDPERNLPPRRVLPVSGTGELAPGAEEDILDLVRHYLR